MTGACCSDPCSVLLVFWVIDAAFRLVQRRAWISPWGHHVVIWESMGTVWREGCIRYEKYKVH